MTAAERKAELELKKKVDAGKKFTQIKIVPAIEAPAPSVVPQPGFTNEQNKGKVAPPDITTPIAPPPGVDPIPTPPTPEADMTGGIQGVDEPVAPAEPQEAPPAQPPANVGTPPPLPAAVATPPPAGEAQPVE